MRNGASEYQVFRFDPASNFNSSHVVGNKRQTMLIGVLSFVKKEAMPANTCGIVLLLANKLLQ